MVSIGSKGGGVIARVGAVPFVARGILSASCFLASFEPKAGVVLLLMIPILGWRVPRTVELMFLVLLGLGLGGYFVLGADQIKPEPLEPLGAIRHAVFSFLFIAALFVMEERESRRALLWLSIGTVVFVTYAGFDTFINNPYAVIHRHIVHPLMDEEVASTGQINAAALSGGVLLFILREKILGWMALLAVVLLSFMYQNRTGMLFSILALGGWLITGRGLGKMWRGLSLVILVSFAGLTISLSESLFSQLMQMISPALSRLSNEGLETTRYSLQLYGFSRLFNGEYVLGGAQVGGLFTENWYHNIFLDAYRVGGVPTMLLFLCAILISLRRMLALRSASLFFIWTVAFLLAISSVPMEGFMVEYCAIFSVFSYTVLARPYRIINQYRWQLTPMPLHIGNNRAP